LEVGEQALRQLELRQALQSERAMLLVLQRVRQLRQVQARRVPER
jgi:hypothetical protein